jgi:hypothetical protein
MAKVKITKEEANEMMKVKGDIRGAVFKAFYSYIIDKKGEEGVRAVEKKLKELGHPLDLENIKSFQWYSQAFAAIVCLVILETFDWDESAALDMGYNGPLFSTAAKLLVKYFTTPEKGFRQIPKVWRQHVNFAEPKIFKYNKEKKYSLFRIEGYKKFHPVVYEYMKGFILRFTELLLNVKGAKIKQTKCLFWGDPYDEFRVTW